MRKFKEQFWKKKQSIMLAVFAAVLILFAVGIWNEVALHNAQEDFIALLEAETGNYNEDRVVLSSTNRQEAQHMARMFGGTLRITKDGSFAVINLPEGMTLLGIAENDNYRKYHNRISLDYNNFETVEENTEFVEDAEVRANYQVNDPMYPQQTYLDYLNIGDTWNITLGADSNSEKVTVAIIDTGIDTDHPEFYDAEGNSIISTSSYDATNDKVVDQYDISVIEDTDGHGTAVAGVLAAQMNDAGIVGVSPEVKLLVIKCETDGTGKFKSSADIVFALYYAIEQDADIINMSLGGTGSTDMSRALQLAVDSNIICVAAAGNDGTSAPHYPAAYDTVIGVGALEDDSWEIAGYSNYGVNSDIMAPGTVLTAAIGGEYTYKNGTSMSAPMVSAAAALYVSQNKYVTYEELKADLLAAGKDLGDLGEDTYYGFGALDIKAFVCEEKGAITYDYCTQDFETDKQIFVRQHTIQTVPEPERENIIFDDWYYDKAYTRVFDYDAWYTTEFVEDVTLYAKWVNEDDEDASVYNYKTLSDGTIEIVNYKGKRRYLIIPDEIDGKIVSSIGTSAFAGNTRLREVTFPGGLVYIKNKAFAGVSKLREITFTGTKLVEMQKAAFQGCTSLRKVDIPDSVQTIGADAFNGCASLTSVTISEDSSLTCIEAFAFSNTAISSFYIPQNVTSDGFDGSVLAYCPKMYNIQTHFGNSSFTVDGNTLYNTDKTEIIYYPAARTGTYVVADGVVAIGNYAFTGSTVAGLGLNAVVTIGEYAFTGTKNLSAVTLPNTVTDMGDFAFRSSSINQVILSENLTSIATGAFYATNLTSVYFPANVKTISEAAFMWCNYMESVSFDENAMLQTIEGGKESGAFANCRCLEDLKLPESLETIGERAFYGCYKLTDVTIPVNVKSIGDAAFQYCTQLQQVDFAFGCALMEIPSYCFANCTSLNTVNFSDGITKLGTYAFSNDRLLNRLNFGENSGLSTISDYCFYSCSLLRTTQLPQSVTAIGQFAYAFSGLSKVHINADVTDIGNAAFGACFALTEITVDENNTAFAAVNNVLFDKNITTVYCVPSSHAGSYTLPESVTVTAPYSFYYDQLLTAVMLPAGLHDIQQNSFYNCSSLGGIEIPSNVTNIGRKAFENCYKLISVTFGTGSKLQRLGGYTFVNCGFSQITIPASVEEISQYVFYNCGNLKKITFEKNSKLSYIAAYLLKGTRVENIVFEDGSALTDLQAHAFDGANYLKSVDFGDAALASVDNYAFYNCLNLEEIILPDTVTYIGRYAFYNCALLDRIDIPAAVEFIGQSAFYGTNSIKVFFAAEFLPAYVETDWDKSVAGYFLSAIDYVVTDEWEYAVTRNGTISLAKYKGADTELIIDTLDGYIVEKIGAKCFYDNDSITKITLSEEITEIGNYAFYDCDGLTALSVPASVEKIGKHTFADSTTVVAIAENSALAIIDDYAFSGNVTTNLSLPNGVTKIGEGAFYDSDLSTLTISENSSLQTIGRQAFVDSNIVSIYLPASLENIGVEAFKALASLTTVEIAGGDTQLKLSNSAFEGCGISEIVVPARVYYIGEYTFGSCPALRNIDVDTDNASYTSLDGVLCDVYGTTLIQYPCGRSGAYEVPGQITVLNYASFKNAKTLTEVSFAAGSTVKTIGWQTFSGCDSLKKITVPDTIVSFDFYAFENCTALTDVILGTGTQLNSVYEGVFYKCNSLSNITLPDTVVEIGDYAFYGCSALTSVPLTENAQVKSIYNYAFYECTGITEIPAFTQLIEIGEYAFGYTNITEYTVSATVKDIASSAFTGCDNFTAIYCNEENTEYTSIDGTLYEKGTTSASDYDALKVWPYGNILVLGKGRSEITAEDTEFLREMPEIQWEIANSVTTIADRAFVDFEEIKFIVVPENVLSIGSFAFSGCDNAMICFTAESVPTKLGTNWSGTSYVVTNVEDHGSTDSGFSYCTTKDGRAVVGVYFGMDTVVKIPEQIDGKIVDEIVGCFANNSALIDVEIPKTVTLIGSNTFHNCKMLKSITIGEHITHIGKNAFAGCLRLSEISFNASNMEDLESNVFAGAGVDSGGITVTIGQKVSRIPAYLFHVSGSNKAPNVTELVFEGESACQSIGAYSFENNKIRSLTIPESIVKIENSAFSYSFYLEQLNFNATKIAEFTEGNTIFGYAGRDSGGVQVIIGNNVMNIPDYFLYSWYGSFQPNIISVTFEEDSQCERIGVNAFSNLRDVPSITIPKKVKTIGANAFSGSGGMILLFESNTLPEDLGGSWSLGAVECLNPQKIGEKEGYFYYITSDGEAVIARYRGKKTNLVLPDQIEGFPVTQIAVGMFYGNESLESVTIPKSVKSIGDLAFYRCTGLQEVVIPDNVKNLGSSAFGGCTNVSRISIGEGVETIGDSAFDQCYNVEVLQYNAVSVADWTDYNGIFFRVGEHSGGYEVIIGSNVTTIPAHLFHTFGRNANVIQSYITSLTFEEGSKCTRIGSYAFIDCDMMKCVVIPESVTSIASNAFARCTGLTILFEGENLPKNLGTHWAYQAAVCTNVKSFGYTEKGIFYCVRNDGTAIVSRYHGDSDTVEIPASIENVPVTEIADFMLYDRSSIRYVVIPDSMLSIGDYAFNGSGKRMLIFMGNELPGTLGENWSGYSSQFMNVKSYVTTNPEFFYCVTRDDTVILGEYYGNKTAVIVPASIGNLPVVKMVGTFRDNTDITTVVIPDGLVAVDDHTFNGCSNLGSVALPDSITTIGTQAFYNCTSMKSIVIPASVKSIGSSAFSGCRKLSLVYLYSPDIISGCAKASSAGYLCNNAETVVIPANVAEVGGYLTSNFAIAEAASIDEADCVLYSKHEHTWNVQNVIAEPVNCVQNGQAVYRCPVCTVVKVAEIPAHTFTNYISDNNATCTEDGTQTAKCDRCDAKNTILDKESVLGHNFVHYVSNGDHLCIKDGTKTAKCERCDVTDTTTDEGSAPGHTAVEGVCEACGAKLNGSNGNNTSFWEMDGSTLTIYGTGVSPSGWSSVCPWIETVIIEDGITSIPISAFKDCTRLAHVSMSDTLTTIPHGAFQNCSSLQSIEIGINVTKIDSYAFSECVSLTKISIPDTVTSIGQCAFSNCSELERVAVGGAVSKIGYGAFQNCTNLVSVELNEGITNLDSYAFANCKSLREIIIPDSVAFIGQCAFARCSSLERVLVGSGVTSISYGAFENCSKLISVRFYGNAPSINSYAFYNTTTTCYYLEGDTTWTTSMFKNYMGTLTWQAFAVCTEHDYETVTVEPSCAKQGYATHTCTVCGDSYVDSYTNALGHSFTEYVSNNNATCTEDGTKTAKCDRCDVTDIVTDTGSKVEHNYVDGACENCGKVEWEVSFGEKVYHNLRLQDLTKIGYAFTITTDVSVDAYGVLIWTGDADAEVTVDTEGVQNKILTYDSGFYTAESDGIYAQRLDVVHYAKPYVKIGDQYIYGSVDTYSPLTYAQTVLNGNDAKLKQLMIDLLNYGTYAQLYFAETNKEPVPDVLINNILADEQKVMNWSDDLKVATPTVTKDTEKTLETKWYGTNLNLLEAIQMNMAATGDIAGMYYWTEDAYNSAEILDGASASGQAVIRIDGSYTIGGLTGIVAQSVSDVYYVCGYDVNGNLGAIRADSVAAYATRLMESTASTEATKNLAKALLVYGNSAAEYFV